MAQRTCHYTDEDGYAATLTRAGGAACAYVTVEAPDGCPSITATADVDDVTEETAKALLERVRDTQPMFSYRRVRR